MFGSLYFALFGSPAAPRFSNVFFFFLPNSLNVGKTSPSEKRARSGAKDTQIGATFFLRRFWCSFGAEFGVSRLPFSLEVVNVRTAEIVWTFRVQCFFFFFIFLRVFFLRSFCVEFRVRVGIPLFW